MATTSASVVRDELNTYSHVVLNGDLDSLNDYKRSWILARYFVEKMLPSMGFSDELIDHFTDGYVDGSGDLGVDILIKLGNQVHLIQSKFISQKKNIENSVVESWHRAFERLENYKNLGNKEIIEISSYIEWHSDNFFLWFITTGRLDGQTELAKDSEIVLPAALKDKGLTIDQIESDFFDQARFKEEIQNSKNQIAEISKITADIYPIKEGSKRAPIITFDEDEADLTTVVMVVESEQLVKIYNDYKKNIFALNVRQFLGQTKKNKGIKESAKSDPQRFFFYNNGVSAVAEHLEIYDDHVSVKGLSIINGAQTVKSLSEARALNPQPKVLLRISEVRLKEKRGILDNIIRYNNTQNEIKNSDFRSNDLIQKHFVEEFAKLKRGSQNCEYRPKRIEKGKKAPDKLIILLTDFAKYIYSFIQEPYSLEISGVTSLFSTEGGKLSSYEQIFGSKDENIPREEFLYRAGIYFLAIEFLAQLSGDKKGFTEPDKRDACERGTFILYIASKILDRLEKDVHTFSKNKFLQILATHSKWSMNGTDGLSKFVNLLYQRSITTAYYRYRSEKSKNPPISLRNWQRGSYGTKENLIDYINIEFEADSLKDKAASIIEYLNV